MRAILPTLLLLALCAASLPPRAHAQDASLDRLFGITVGEPLPLSSKQVQPVASPGTGMERYMLLFTPSGRAPYAHHFATTDSAQSRVVRVMGQTRKHHSRKAVQEAFEKEMKKLDKEFGTGMRLGGGNIWKRVQAGRSLTLVMDNANRTLSLVLANEDWLRAYSARK